MKKRKSTDTLREEYSYVYKIGCEVTKEPVHHVERGLLMKQLKVHNISKQFGKLFGIQTVCVTGPYAWDVEAVLTHIYAKKLIGSQLIMD